MSMKTQTLYLIFSKTSKKGLRRLKNTAIPCERILIMTVNKKHGKEIDMRASFMESVYVKLTYEMSKFYNAVKLYHVHCFVSKSSSSKNFENFEKFLEELCNGGPFL